MNDLKLSKMMGMYFANTEGKNSEAKVQNA